MAERLLPKVPPPRGLEDLPPELLQNILIELDSYSIKSAVLSGAAFNRALKDREGYLSPRFIQRQIPADLMHAALAVYFTIGARKWPTKDIAQFPVNYFTLDESYFEGPLTLSLSQAVKMAELHKVVEFLGNKLASDALALMNFDHLRPVQPPTSTEFNRIYRALYRVEVHRNICPEGVVWPPNGAKFPSFSPWENEQVACVYQALRKIVYPAVEQLMGEGSPEPQERNMEQQTYANATNQIYLGLSHVKRHAEATAVLARNSLGLQRDIAKGGLFDYFLRYALQPWMRDVGDRQIDGAEGEMAFEPWYSDPDSGPEDIWALGPFGRETKQHCRQSHSRFAPEMGICHVGPMAAPRNGNYGPAIRRLGRYKVVALPW
ncbi:uncharacterized protein N7496_011450 [Penicillium cataractarum]|uniref:F-box domain-containing protein n=1 Tax=Penicillium cataractarum TaxID=2100454 RepID=A0A9W9UVL9_9EURO|nr:uncharacterized protein N7496_011450 [Penicillium cataractarum]KAJ5359037.1 hypothetical protein N7496_011450 [Penicillium cataractarum]